MTYDLKVQECDATGDEQSDEVGFIKKLHHSSKDRNYGQWIIC